MGVTKWLGGRLHHSIHALNHENACKLTHLPRRALLVRGWIMLWHNNVISWQSKCTQQLVHRSTYLNLGLKKSCLIMFEFDHWPITLTFKLIWDIVTVFAKIISGLPGKMSERPSMLCHTYWTVPDSVDTFCRTSVEVCQTCPLSSTFRKDCSQSQSLHQISDPYVKLLAVRALTDTQTDRRTGRRMGLILHPRPLTQEGINLGILGNGHNLRMGGLPQCQTVGRESADRRIYRQTDRRTGTQMGH